VFAFSNAAADETMVSSMGANTAASDTYGRHNVISN
jgi:hypothetical protein